MSSGGFWNVSVVIPVYDGEATLEELAARLFDVLSQACNRFEVVMVNDGSRDKSWPTIRQLAQRYPFVRGVNLTRNFGQHNALLCGIRHARHEVIVTMDDDLQHPPEEIPKLLAALEDGNNDVVYGAPRHEQHGLWRDLASQVTKLALRATMGVETARHVSAFRAFRSLVCVAFADYQGPFVSIDVLLTWATTRFAAIPVRHDTRRIGTSNYTFRKLVTHALNMMTGFSTLPLQLASMMGFAFTLFGLGALAYVVGRYLLQGSSVPGFPFLASLVAILSGAQLFALGIIGEYLARMHFRSMGRPSSVVRDTVGLDPSERRTSGG